MANDGPDPPLVDLEAELARSIRMVVEATQRMEDLLLDFQTTPETDLSLAKRLADQASEVRKNVRVMMEERGRVQDAQKATTGSAGGVVLDIDAARLEVGRRLSKLRAAGSADGVSGWSVGGDPGGAPVGL